jgi:enamine deaminase RidA (YjgF/YER057c/UK114 family)
MISAADTPAVEELMGGCPLLAGQPAPRLLAGAGAPRRSGGWTLWEQGAWLQGSISVPVSSRLALMTEEVYRSLLEAAGRRHLARVWNHVPGINAPGTDHLENYRAFCLGRSLAFEAHHGPDFRRYLPAASAVGAPGDRLTVVFAASTAAPCHFENPAQVPAYQYPPQYGPRPPSFARATVVSAGRDRVAFISGTSAITGHDTIAPFDTPAQLECTLSNLAEISRACGLGADLGAGRAQERQFRVYLRRSDDLTATAATLASRLLRPGDCVSYLQADICRRELNVEIEATLRGFE